MIKHLLKDYIEDQTFINKMDLAFADLRADYELSLDVDNKKITELIETHVDVKNQLSNLSTFSLSSSGVISGLRGTGKTHLMFLARHRINENCFTGDNHRVFCVYLNVKRFSLPEKFDQEIFNRAFSVFLYNELSKQLTSLVEQLKNQTICQKFLSLFDGDRKKTKNSIEAALIKLIEFREIAKIGDSQFRSLSIGTMGETTESRSVEELIATIKTNVGLSDSEFGIECSGKVAEEIGEQLTQNNTYLKYLSINSIHEELISILKILRLNGITFYVDEWEKISYNPDIQKFLSFYIDRILDDPIYFWISVVPYRGGLFYLDNGADLQHFIDLDENLIFENSSRDRDICINYFKEFVNKRLFYYLGDKDISVDLLFNNNHNFEKLVLASMGNSRDFGTMLLTCWSEFRSYRMGQLPPGRPYQYISETMVNTAIKNDGEKKMSNINNSPETLKVWHDLETFCVSKHSSHLAIEENRDNIDCLSRTEFSDLIYHRLLHLRKSHVTAKDISVESKLSIYALNYSSTYDLHSKDKKLVFVKDYSTIHDKVRRYIYDPTQIISRLQIQAGEVFPCTSCGEKIIIGKMIAAWENNACPFCGGKIRGD